MANNQQCPDCGNYMTPGHQRRCVVPILTEAIGVELTPREARLIHWLASTLDTEQATVMAGLFERMRADRRSDP